MRQVLAGLERRTDGSLSSPRRIQKPFARLQSQVPFTIFQTGPAGTPGLAVNMIDGLIIFNAQSDALPTLGEVSMAETLVADDATTFFWITGNLKVSDYHGLTLWWLDTYAVNSGSALPANTWNPGDITAGAGAVHVEIASVEAAGGVITAVNQELKYILPLTMPLGFPKGISPNDLLRWDGSKYIPVPAPSSTGLHMLTVDSGTMGWMELDSTDWECPEN